MPDRETSMGADAEAQDASAELRASVQYLYAAFERYPLRPVIPGCPHCALERAEGALHVRELRELTWEDLGVFPFKAMTTFGEEEDFKHFLPRILELHAQDPEGSHYDIDITLQKLEYAAWRGWPASERRAVHRFIDAWLRTLTAHGAQGSSSQVLEDLRSALGASDFPPPPDIE